MTRSPLVLALAAAALAVIPVAVSAEDAPDPCGSSTADTAGCAEDSPDALIDGKPAAVEGSKSGCDGKIASGPTSVFVNGQPFIIAGPAADCGKK